MNRRQALGALLAALTPSSLVAANPSVSTLIGTGSRGYSDHEVNNPYGLVIGPDRALYFCDLDNQRIRRLDLKHASNHHCRGQRPESLWRRRRTGDRRRLEHAARNSIRFRRQHLHRRARQSRGSQGRGQDRHHLDIRGNRHARIFRGWRARGTRPASPASQHCRGSQRQAADLRHREPPHSTGRFFHRHDRHLWRHRRATTDARRRAGEDGAVERAANPEFRSRRQSLSRAARRQRDLPHRIESRNDPSSGRHRRARLFGRRRAGPPGEARGSQGARLWRRPALSWPTPRATSFAA